MLKTQPYRLELIGLLGSLAAVGLMFFFSMDVQNDSLKIREEVSLFIENKQSNLLLIVVAGACFGAIVDGTLDYLAARRQRMIALRDVPKLSLLLLVVDVAVIVVLIAYLIVSSLAVTLIVWLIVMFLLLVVPAIFRARKIPQVNVN